MACSEYGEESCIARFLAMEACTFIFGLNSGKPPQEAMNIASDMFVLIMQGNKLKLSDMYNQSGKIKPEIKSKLMKELHIVEMQLKRLYQNFIRHREEKIHLQKWLKV